MDKLIRYRQVKIFIFLITSLGLIAVKGFTSDWPTILKNIKEKNLKFEQEVKDSFSLHEIVSYTHNTEFTLEFKLYTKGIKNRIEAKAKTNGQEKNKEMMFTIYDGKNTYLISPDTGKAKKVNNASENPSQLNFNWWKKLPEKAKSIKTSKIKQKECYEVTFEKTSNPEFIKLWLDKQNLNLIQADALGENEIKGQKIVYFFSDFKKIKDDFQIPYTTKIYMGNQILTSITIKNFTINQGLSNDLFEPEKIKAKAIKP